MPECRIVGCRDAVLAREMCKTHYHRWHRHGDPEIVLRRVGIPPQERFWVKAWHVDSGCWEWQGKRNKQGYGLFKLEGQYVLAHRFAYEALIAEIPEGLEIDHLCRNRACVNPYHLDPVTHVVNMRRGERASRDCCGRGHPFDAMNTGRKADGSRICRACARLRDARYKRKKLAAAAS